jgi:hypothetical protein
MCSRISLREHAAFEKHLDKLSRVEGETENMDVSSCKDKRSEE